MYDVNTPDPSDFIDHSKALSAVYPDIPDECFETGRFTAYYDTDGLILQQINEYNAHRNIILRRRRIVDKLRIFVCTLTVIYTIYRALLCLSHFSLVLLGFVLSAAGVIAFGFVLKKMYLSAACIIFAFVSELSVSGISLLSILENPYLYFTAVHFALAFLWEITEKKFSKERGYPKFLRIIVFQKEGTQAFFENFEKK